MKSILLLEDEKSLSRGISFKLKKEGYTVYAVSNIKDARDMFKNNEIDLIISDVGLPDGSGFDFCEEIRKISNVHIIMLTALDQEVDIVTGYEIGADDYITKPFSLIVLISKVNAFMRRIGDISNEHIITSDQLSFDYLGNKLLKENEELMLSKTEGKLLKYLMENSCHTITKDQLMEALWDIDGNYVDENTIAVNIRRLRQKVEENPSSPKYIKNIRGVGYTFAKRCTKK
ncbi:response regulator transcription factor [Clostridium butyricum]|uniref:response regulator transcription factor n=1 Tax=Clostridium butyricum TaxID=1492 RepID=UPI0013D5E804|nr:response regulator transcription factor [Clostridium butyricum]MCQ2012671.1 response regulator transcription factor [Clostridium butyricum]MCQ2017030.1 response regulator transcription factor [Clostridium butyricum]MCQ2020930.1 response regulator transcription factor [Clostridium butyricum]MCQ2025081.1 response regulator transcription factor [Clostridium butyricum]NFB72071.1 response regulator transcription factor [Clostridium butyricum]